MKPFTRSAYKLLHDGVLALADIEQTGMRIDVEYVKKQLKFMDKKVSFYEDMIRESPEGSLWLDKYGDKMNVNSNQQLGDILFNSAGYEPTGMTEKGNFSLDKKALSALDASMVRDIEQMRKYKKVKSTYLEGILKQVGPDGLLHPFFNLHTVSTYRSSSSAPNFQNIPVRDPEIKKIVRRMFLPRKGRLIAEADYSGVEVKIAACVTADTKVETIEGPLSIQDIIKKVEKKQKVYVYSYDLVERRRAVSKVTAGGLTGVKKKIWELLLDNGQTLRATADHKILLRNGEYRCLSDLQPGDSLMPFRKDIVDGYEYVVEGCKMVPAHRLIMHDLCDHFSLDSSDIVHHIDENKLNNSFSNLCVCSRSDHVKLHHTGKVRSSVARQNISRSKKGIPFNGVAWNKGLTKEKDSRILAISLSLRGRPAWNKGKRGLYKASEETKQKLSIALQGRSFSDSTRAKLSNNKKRYWEKKKTEKVVCSICGKSFVSLTNTHLKNHELSVEDYKKAYNHKVVSVTYCGKEDVYNINVDKRHNYVISAGIIIKNCYHKDPVMLEYICDPTKDMHRDTAMECYLIDKPENCSKDARYCGKNKFVFPQFYGDYYINCARALWDAIDQMELKVKDTPMKDHLRSKGVRDYSQFEMHIKKVEDSFWKSKFMAYSDWKDEWVYAYNKKLYFDTLTGFRCSGVMERNQAINFPVQGSAFHCLLWSLINVHRQLKRGKFETKIIGQIHDSIVLDVAANEIDDVVEILNQTMVVDLLKHWDWIIVPLEIEVDATPVDGSWYTKEKYITPEKD